MELEELFIPSFPRQCSAELFETDRWANYIMYCVMGTNLFKLVFNGVSALFTLSGGTSGLHLMV